MIFLLWLVAGEAYGVAGIVSGIVHIVAARKSRARQKQEAECQGQDPGKEPFAVPGRSCGNECVGHELYHPPWCSIVEMGTIPWAEGGRSPDLRVAGSLAAFPVLSDQWHVARSLSAHSCGGSHGFGP